MIVNIRNYAIIFTVSLYILFNYGFQVITLPPGKFGVPIGEIIILLSIVFVNYKNILPKFFDSKVQYILLPLFIIGFYHLSLDVPKYGFWAIRDASHLIETIYIFLGFLVTCKNIKFLESKLPKFLWLATTYSLLFPIRFLFQQLFPVISTSSGNQTSLLMFITSPSILICNAFAIFTDNNKAYIKKYIISSIFILFTFAIFQSRTPFLQVLFLFIFCSLIYKRIPVQFLFVSLLVIFALALYPLFDINIETRLGIKYDLTNFFNHFLSIFGIAKEGFEKVSFGVIQRLTWWQNIWIENSSDFVSLIFGRGYGFPLVDFETSQLIVVREPHNSVISAFARIGLLGALLFIILHIYLIFKWVETYNLINKLKNIAISRFIVLVMMWFILTWTFSIGEDAFEKPFWAIPFYFYFGVILKINYLAKRIISVKLPYYLWKRKNVLRRN